jgi:hypothetical protein
MFVTVLHLRSRPRPTHPTASDKVAAACTKDKWASTRPHHGQLRRCDLTPEQKKALPAL